MAEMQDTTKKPRPFTGSTEDERLPDNSHFAELPVDDSPYPVKSNRALNKGMGKDPYSDEDSGEFKDVTDDGGWKYRMFSDGRVRILEAPPEHARAVGVVLKSDDQGKAASAIRNKFGGKPASPGMGDVKAVEGKAESKPVPPAAARELSKDTSGKLPEGTAKNPDEAAKQMIEDHVKNYVDGDVGKGTTQLIEGLKALWAGGIMPQAPAARSLDDDKRRGAIK